MYLHVSETLTTLRLVLALRVFQLLFVQFLKYFLALALMPGKEVELVSLLSSVSCSPVITYVFRGSEYSECSRSCNGGIRTREVQCFKASDGVPFEQVNFLDCVYFAEDQTLPSNTEECNTFACPVWMSSSFSTVSAGTFS